MEWNAKRIRFVLCWKYPVFPFDQNSIVNTKIQCSIEFRRFTPNSIDLMALHKKRGQNITKSQKKSPCKFIPLMKHFYQRHDFKFQPFMFNFLFKFRIEISDGLQPFLLANKQYISGNVRSRFGRLHKTCSFPPNQFETSTILGSLFIQWLKINL